jgi:hypothetical protein
MDSMMMNLTEQRFLLFSGPSAMSLTLVNQSIDQSINQSIDHYQEMA